MERGDAWLWVNGWMEYFLIMVCDHSTDAPK